MPSLRVLYSFPDKVGKPGIGTTAFHQVAETLAHGIDVDLHCTSLSRSSPGLGHLVETMRIGGVRVPHRALAVEGTYRYHDLRVAKALRKHAGRYDLVHCWPRSCLRTSRAARELGIPVLREVPNTHTEYAFQSVADEAAATGVKVRRSNSHAFSSRHLDRERAEYEAADFLLVPSEFSRRTFMARGFRADRLLMHRYGFEPSRFWPDPDFGRRLSEEPFTALFAGRCEPRKGLHHALRAWVDSGAGDRGRFLVCGEFEPGYREALGPLLAHPSIELRGFVPDLAAVMRSSHALVLPSIEEGSALVTYEARACGCVLLVSDAAGARCRHGLDGLVHSAGDVSQLTAQLRQLATDPGALGRLRDATLSGARDLSWNSAGAELARLYLRCVERPGDGSPAEDGAPSTARAGQLPQ